MNKAFRKLTFPTVFLRSGNPEFFCKNAIIPEILS